MALVSPLNLNPCWHYLPKPKKLVSKNSSNISRMIDLTRSLSMMSTTFPSSSFNHKLFSAKSRLLEKKINQMDWIIKNISYMDKWYTAYETISGQIANEKETVLKRKLAFQLAGVLVDYGIASYDDFDLLVDGEMIPEDPIQQQEFTIHRPLIILKASFVVYIYALGFSEYCPDFVHVNRINELFLSKTSQIEYLFEQKLRGTDFDKLIAGAAKLKHDLVGLSRCIRYISKSLQESIPRTPLEEQLSKETRQYLTSKAAVLCNYIFPCEPDEDIDELGYELSRTVTHESQCPQNLESLSVKAFSKTKTKETKGVYDEIHLLDERLKQLFVRFLGVLAIKCNPGSQFKTTDIHFQYEKCNESLRSKIHNYLRGIIKLDQLDISQENAREYLVYLKLYDWAITQTTYDGFRLQYKNSTFEARLRVLQVCPQIKKPEALMKTLVPGKMWDGRLWLDGNNWITEEAATMGKLCVNQVIRTQALHVRLKITHPRGSIIAVRGGTCSGKSTFLHNLLKDLLQNIEISDGLERGVLNIDTLKSMIRKRTKLQNVQIHDQVSEILPMLIKTIVEMKLNFILDARLITLEKVIENLVSPAKKLRYPVSLTDLDVSLVTMLIRLLLRDPEAEEPRPSLDTVVDAFIELRKHRSNVVAYLVNQRIVSSYKLFKGPKQKLVAEKKTSCGPLLVKNKKAWKNCTRVPNQAEIDQTLDLVITDTHINKAIYKGIIPETKRECLDTWKGMTIKEAVFNHLSENFVDPSFGKITLEPFSAEWLKDLPSLIYHIISEHLLHIRGIDENWYGLHWQAKKFSWKQNPKYNPEAQGGFQMKLGYFIIPDDKVDAIRARFLSQEVWDEVHTEKGFRFFVHPEAYKHYQPLLKAGIPFVKPEESEFMGTPTSSYRSWLVRRNMKTPFIVKLGVSGIFGDTSRFLPKADVERSIKVQEKLNDIQKHSELLIFEENLGLIIPGYSGNIIREIPKKLLEGKVKILSFSALMSAERSKNKGLCALSKGMESLPLIYEIMYATIQKGLAIDAVDFVRKYLIHDYFNAIEEMHFKNGLPFSPHGQNLCMVLNEQNVPAGFAYRDLEGMQEAPYGLIESYSWFYRYHNIVKFLNVMIKGSVEYMPPPPGAPSQRGEQEFMAERKLHPYLKREIHDSERKVLNKMSITREQYLSLLRELDASYLKMLRKYFDVDKAGILSKDGHLPSAEKGSSGEAPLNLLNELLWAHRI